MRAILNFRRGFPGLAEALSERGVTVVENDWAPDAGAGTGLAVCLVDFYEAVRAPWRSFGLHRRLRRMGAPLVALDRDAPWHKGVRTRRLRLARWLPLFDIYAAHSLQGATGFAPAQVYFPNAAWPRVYGLGNVTLPQLRDPTRYSWDVSFVGNIDAARYREHDGRVRFLAELDTRLRAGGRRVLIRDGAGLDAPGQVEVIQRSHINLSVGAACDHGGVRSWGLPERCYGVPACGGFLLCDQREHARDDFVTGREWVTYDDIDDCMRKIDHYLTHLDEARTIAEAAHARVMAHHTYHHRASLLLDLAKAWREGGSAAAVAVAGPYRQGAAEHEH